MTIVALALCAVLSCIAALHVYWALGGRLGIAVSVPQVGSRPAFAPGPILTLLVAGALAGAAAVPLLRTGMLVAPVPDRLVRMATAALAAIFALRAVGDFRLVGFFKRRSESAFARWDTRLYSPLCALLAAGFASLAVR